MLVATDFSPGGNRAVAWAFATAPPGAVVKLVHVVPPWELPNPLIAHYERRRRSRAECRKIAGAARRQLVALIPPSAATREVASEIEVIEDRDPARAIDRAARRFRADLIAVGSRGHGVLASAFLGSIARTILGHHGPPVMVVRRDSPAGST